LVAAPDPRLTLIRKKFVLIGVGSAPVAGHDREEAVAAILSEAAKSDHL
jgi:hypothetical protein